MAALRSGPRLLPRPPPSEPLHQSVTILHKHALFKQAKYVSTLHSQLCHGLCPERSVFLCLGEVVPCQWPLWFLRQALIPPHRPCCVSHCLVCFKTFSIRTLSLSCSLCCSSAPWNAGCGNVTVTRCLDTCREQAVRLCFCGWLSGNHLCSRPGLVISRVASWKSLAFLSLSVFYCCVSWTPWCLTVLILRPMACVYSCPLSSHERL